MKQTILEATENYHPIVYDMTNRGDWLIRDEEDYVIDYSPDLMVSYSKSYGTHQISYKDWTGDFENPIPVLKVILAGHAQQVFMDGSPALVITG
ncbi:MAG: hypothetical protein HUJ54_01130 [Erysipelotrichaceae bacterium]|nr:hypothetical protein [Erysipelotrichaceae bacterium]